MCSIACAFDHLTQFIRDFFQLIKHEPCSWDKGAFKPHRQAPRFYPPSVSFGHSFFLHRSQVDNN